MLCIAFLGLGGASIVMAGREPQVATSGDRAFVVCGEGNRLRVAASADGGATFGKPIDIPTRSPFALGMRRGPRIAVAGRNVVVTAVMGEQAGVDGDLFAWRSTDEGRSWRGPTRVSDMPGAAREGLHATAASSGGRLGCAWLDLRSKGTEIWASTSADGGATWATNVRVYASPSGRVCECCHPSLAFGPKGELVVMFRNWLGGARDMYLSKSPDGGRTFGRAAKLGNGTWPLRACPMDGGAVEVAPDGTVLTAWRRENGVFTAHPGEAEREIGEGKQPWLASGTTVMLEGETVVACRGTTRVELGRGIDPVIAATPTGTLAVWFDARGEVWAARLDR